MTARPDPVAQQMAHYRYSDRNRVTPDATSADVFARVELLRGRATRRKLFLLETAIIRHAPFADCGRPIWELMAEQPWFRTTISPAERARLYEAARLRREPVQDDRDWTYIPTDGHTAIGWVEQYADDPSDETPLVLAGDYGRTAEWEAEADILGEQQKRDGEPRATDEEWERILLRYALAYWLEELTSVCVVLWLDGLQDARARQWNILDFYLASPSIEYYSYASARPFHPDHRAAALDLIDDLLGHPTAPVPAAWQTSTAVGLAAGMYATRDFAAAPVLADALDDAGCDAAELLAHLRADRRHVRGCWAIDAVLRKESGG